MHMELGGHGGEVIAVGIGGGDADGKKEFALLRLRRNDRQGFQFVGQERPGAVVVAAAGGKASPGRQVADHHIHAVVVAEHGKRRVKIEPDRLAKILCLDGRPAGLLVERGIDDGRE